jgi:PKD repeat protein
LAFVIVLIGGAAAACRQRDEAASADAATDGTNDGRSALSLEIAVTGCAAFDGAAARCSGPAPLVLSFSPVGSREFTRFQWRFGDGTPVVSERAPVHSYPLPGSYEVTLIGAGDVGNISSNRPVAIVVEPVGVGRPCDVDGQCGGGLRCACTPGSGCPAAFVRGLCTTGCDTSACASGAVCGMFGFGAASGPEGDGGDAGPAVDAGSLPARLASCLGGCQTSGDCATGFVCQALPSGGGQGAERWVRGCLPLGAAGDLGAPCRSAVGSLDDVTCATGTCADLGALGSCSATCDTNHACPDTTACARLPDGRQLCLLECAGSNSCTRDPLLECSAPAGSDGGAGYQTDASPGATYCAPKACVGDADCAPAGRCGPGARCVRR